jgi:hypothetical protein
MAWSDSQFALRATWACLGSKEAPCNSSPWCTAPNMSLCMGYTFAEIAGNELQNLCHIINEKETSSLTSHQNQ